ncbi:TRAP transporter large permease [Pelomicrobium sp. G1]|uniref:TRAP transporter large permease n=1 Tax=unclassified Pelomicrobium TaxID=2815318 RepID=UPI003F76D5EB
MESAGLIAITLLFLFMLLSIPVFISMGLAAFIGFVMVKGIDLAIASFGDIVWQSASIFELVAIPLFIFTGVLVEKIEAGRDLFDFAKAWVGNVPNSLGAATILACGVFAAISGSSIATAATVGIVAIPLLLQERYSQAQAGGFCAGGGTLGIIIPPSIPFILYGVITETSIGKLFIAGILPGILMMSLFMLYVVLASRPRIVVRHTPSPGQRREAARRGIGILLLPIVIIAAIYTGLFTPTEVGALSAVYVLLLGFVQRRLTWRRFLDASSTATRTTCMLLMLVVFGQYFAHFLTFEQVPQTIAGWITAYDAGPFVTVTLMILVYLVLGMFLESAAMLLISIPIFFPIAMHVGMDPITFGVFACIAMEIAQISPPVGINLYTIHGVSRIPLWNLAKGAAPFLLIQLGMLYVVYYFPALSLWLPQHMIGR